MNTTLIFSAIGGVLALVIFIILAKAYIKAAPDEAIIISGFRKQRVIIGHSGFCIPFLERADVISLKLIPIDVKTKNAVPTEDYINVNVDAVVNVKISDDPKLLQAAGQNFLNKNTETIKNMVVDVLEGNLREIVGQMKLVDLVKERKQVSEKVFENASPDLQKLGIEIKTFNIQNFTDDSEVIKNLGVDKAVAISKEAAISRANAKRDIQIAEAQTAKEANDAKVKADLEIAEKQNELAVRKANLQKVSDTEKAIADAAYKIQEQKQLKDINIAAAEASIAKQEKEAEVRAKMVAVREKELEAEIQKKAEADRQAQIQKSEAALYQQQKAAEATRFEEEQRAIAIQKIAQAEKDKALAEAEAVKAKGLAEAEAIKAKGLADAESAKAKGLAEAEALDKKAEAMKKYGEAARQEMQLKTLETYFEQMPEIAKAIAAPLGKIGNITMYGEGNTAKLTGDITKTFTQVSNGITDAMGIDLKTIIASMFGAKLAGVGNKPAAIPAEVVESVKSEAVQPKFEPDSNVKVEPVTKVRSESATISEPNVVTPQVNPDAIADTFGISKKDMEKVAQALNQRRRR